MGTRNLICVFSEDDFRVAQYSQWDGMPSGQGVCILSHLRREGALARLREGAQRCVLLDSAGLLELCQERATISVLWGDRKMPQTLEEVSPDISRSLYEENPQFSRDHGSAILDYVCATELGGRDRQGRLRLRDELAFAGDSLMCEYAYVLDLDREVLEVYRGFQKSEPPPLGRLGEARSRIPRRALPTVGSSEYWQVALWETFPLAPPPTDEYFLNQLKEEDDDD